MRGPVWGMGPRVNRGGGALKEGLSHAEKHSLSRIHLRAGAKLGSSSNHLHHSATQCQNLATPCASSSPEHEDCLVLTPLLSLSSLQMVTFPLPFLPSRGTQLIVVCLGLSVQGDSQQLTIAGSSLTELDLTSNLVSGWETFVPPLLTALPGLQVSRKGFCLCLCPTSAFNGSDSGREPHAPLPA